MKTVSPTMIATSQMSAQTGTGRISASRSAAPLMTAEPYTPRNKAKTKAIALVRLGEPWPRPSSCAGVRAPRRSCHLRVGHARKR